MKKKQQRRAASRRRGRRRRRRRWRRGRPLEIGTGRCNWGGLRVKHGLSAKWCAIMIDKHNRPLFSSISTNATVYCSVTAFPLFFLQIEFAWYDNYLRGEIGLNCKREGDGLGGGEGGAGEGGVVVDEGGGHQQGGGGGNPVMKVGPAKRRNNLLAPKKAKIYIAFCNYCMTHCQLM